MRNVIIPLIFITGIATAVILYGCRTQKQTNGNATSKPTKEVGANPETPPKWSLLREGAVGNAEAETQFIIKTEAEWAKVWKETNQNFEPEPPRPPVDFSKDWIIACMMGLKRSGGYNVRIKDIKAAGDELKVMIENTGPGKNCMSIDLMTYPYAFYTVAHYKQSKVTFNVNAISKDCTD